MTQTMQNPFALLFESIGMMRCSWRIWWYHASGQYDREVARRLKSLREAN